MKFTRLIDTIFNVFFPVCLGYFIYCLGRSGNIHPLIKNYLPDGLWAWSFISAILIIWYRHINFAWVVITCLLSAGFELLQHLEIMPGTADLVDIIAYLFSMALALYTNNYFKKLYPTT